MLFLLVVLAYVAATVLSLRALDASHAGARKLSVHVLTLACGLQLAELLVAWCWLGPESLRGAALALGLFAVVLSGGFAAFASKYRAESAGVLVAPAALVAGVLSAATSHASPVANADFSWARPLHVITVSSASGLMALAAALAFVYLSQDARLKRKDTSLAPRALVPLDVLDRTAGRLSYTAFFIYTVAVLAGAFMLRAHGVTGVELAWRAIAGVGTWLTFGAVVAHRLLGRAHGRRAMRGVIAGFAVSMVLYGAYATLASGVAGHSTAAAVAR